MGSVGSNRGLIGAAALFLAVAAQPAAVAEAPAEKAAVLKTQTPIEIPEPDYSVLEPEVAQQLRQARNSLGVLLEQGAGPTELAESYGALGKLFHAYDLLQSAEACYLNARRLAPQAFAWTYYLGYLYQSQGRSEATEEQYTHAVRLQPDSALARVRLGDVLLHLGKTEQAKQEYLNASYLRPAATAVFARLGEVALTEKRYELATKYLKIALHSQPEADRLNYLLGMALRGLGQHDQARAMLAKSGPVGVQPPDPYADELKQLVVGERLYLLRGKMAFDAGQFQQAAEAFAKAVAARTDSARAHTNLAAVLPRLGRQAEAIDHLREALRLDPASDTAAFNLAQLLLNAGELTQALPLLEAVVKKHARDAEAHLALARAYRHMGRSDDALELYRKTVRIDPTVEDAWIEGSQLLINLGRLDAALEVLEQAHAKLPLSSRIAHALARMLAGAPDPDLRDGARALPLAEQAHAAQPGPIRAETLAMAHAETGDCGQAAVWQQKALEAFMAAGVEMPQGFATVRGTLERYRAGEACVGPAPARN